MSIEQRILRARLAAGYDIRKGSELLAPLYYDLREWDQFLAAVREARAA